MSRENTRVVDLASEEGLGVTHLPLLLMQGPLWYGQYKSVFINNVYALHAQILDKQRLVPRYIHRESR